MFFFNKAPFFSFKVLKFNMYFLICWVFLVVSLYFYYIFLLYFGCNLRFYLLTH